MLTALASLLIKAILTGELLYMLLFIFVFTILLFVCIMIKLFFIFLFFMFCFVFCSFSCQWLCIHRFSFCSCLIFWFFVLWGFKYEQYVMFEVLCIVVLLTGAVQMTPHHLVLDSSWLFVTSKRNKVFLCQIRFHANDSHMLWILFSHIESFDVFTNVCSHRYLSSSFL